MDTWKGPDETERIEPLNSDKSSLPVKAALPSLSEVINHTLPGESVMASPEVIALQDSADSPQDLPSPSLFASRYIVRLKSQQIPKDEAPSVNYKGRCTIL